MFRFSARAATSFSGAAPASSEDSSDSDPHDRGDIYTLAPAPGDADILGVSIEHSKWDPARPHTRSTGRRTFRLEAVSNVDVVVNGLSVRSCASIRRLYVSDLPVSAVDDLVLLIEDDVGHMERLDSRCFRQRPAAQGLSEWSLAGGVLSSSGPASPTTIPTAVHDRL